MCILFKHNETDFVLLRFCFVCKWQIILSIQYSEKGEMNALSLSP